MSVSIDAGIASISLGYRIQQQTHFQGVYLYRYIRTAENYAANVKWYHREGFGLIQEDRARKMPLPGGLANAAAAAVWAVSTSTALLQPVDTSSSLLFEWLTCPRAVTKWLSRCIMAFLRDHRRRSLFVCDAPCLHASASFWRHFGRWC